MQDAVEVGEEFLLEPALLKSESLSSRGNRVKLTHPPVKLFQRRTQTLLRLLVEPDAGRLRRTLGDPQAIARPARGHDRFRGPAATECDNRSAARLRFERDNAEIL